VGKKKRKPRKHRHGHGHGRLPAPAHVVFELQDGTLAERDLVPDHSWVCFECGQVDPRDGSEPPCSHEVGFCSARVLAAAELNPPGTVLRSGIAA
jgi:hypothetical protein